MEHCGHYTRGCKFVSPCCNEISSCRFCHDDTHDHQLNRYDVQSIQCNNCHKRQGVSNLCVECGQIFADYFCAICRLFDSHPTNAYFHCEECGICRVGLKENIFHCTKCNMCYDIKCKDTHPCKSELFHTDCCICLTNLFSSRECSVVLNCGHAIHQACSNQWLKKNIGCPLCRKTMLDKESATKYTNFIDDLIKNNPFQSVSKIMTSCNDCGKMNETDFHPLGRKCLDCGSYNTHSK